MSVVIDHVSYSYGRLRVLDDVCASAQAGRITVVAGPNAAGKSTLLRCVIGALVPANGCVRIDGEDVHRASTRQTAQRIAYVAQRSTVSAAFTVEQVVRLARYALSPNHAKVEGALDRLDLADLASRPYHELSAGQQQRVMLARALAQLSGDGHLILDEPFSAMDLRNLRDGLRLIRTLADDGATVVIALHDLTLAAAIADDAWLLDGGRLLAAGPATEVLTPEALEPIFQVEFRWIAGLHGERLLAADIANQPAKAQPAGEGPVG